MGYPIWLALSVYHIISLGRSASSQLNSIHQAVVTSTASRFTLLTYISWLSSSSIKANTVLLITSLFPVFLFNRRNRRSKTLSQPSSTFVSHPRWLVGRLHFNTIYVLLTMFLDAPTDYCATPVSRFPHSL